MKGKKPLLAGFAKIDITPLEPQGMGLHGMPRWFHGARGILDPLYARACYLESGHNRFLLIECDLVEMLTSDYAAIIAALARANGLKKANIWLCTTHCHSAVGGADGPFQHKVLNRYLDRFAAQLIAVGQAARQQKQRVKIGYGQAEIENVTGNRRVKLADGTVITGWADGPSPPPGMRIVDRGPIDKNVGLVAFRDMRGRPLGAIINYNSHIHSYPTLCFSSELPGAVAARLEKTLPGLTAVYTNGAEGNTSLCANLPPQYPHPDQWNRQYQQERDRMSAIIVRGIMELYRGLQFESLVTMRLDETARKIHTARPRKGVKTVSAVTINHLALVGEEDESFVEFALTVKKRSPYPTTLVIGLKGDLNYYFYPETAREEGGYETEMPLPPGSFERTTTDAIALLKKMHRGNPT
jgi:hypothetical protein